jgi:hypothetical protein
MHNVGIASEMMVWQGWHPPVGWVGQASLETTDHISPGKFCPTRTGAWGGEFPKPLSLLPPLCLHTQKDGNRNHHLHRGSPTHSPPGLHLWREVAPCRATSEVKADGTGNRNCQNWLCRGLGLQVGSSSVCLPVC